MQAVEARRVSVSSERGVQGDVTEITFQNQLGVDQFRREVFGARSVFRLLLTWDSPSGPNSCRFDAMDMHAGVPVTITMTEGERPRATISLPGNACGNIVPRLLVNLQQFVDATAACSAFESATAAEG